MKVIEYLSYLLIPIMIGGIIIYGMKKKQKVYDSFLKGVGEGLQFILKIFPTVLGIIVAINVFRASGAMEVLIWMVSPITRLFGIPNEIVPLGIMRSVSGGASLGLLTDTLKTYGADSMVGLIASTIMGASETTLYVLAVYTGAVGIKKTKNLIYIALFCDFIALVVSVAIWRIM